MGIDQSLRKTAIVINKDNTLLYHTVIHTLPIAGSNNMEDLIRRCKVISAEVHAVYSAYKPERITIEDLSYNSKGNATRDLAVLFGMIVRLLPKVQTVPPTTLKLFASGSGKADKKTMLAALEKANPTLHAIFSSYTIEGGKYDLVDAYYASKYHKEIPNGN